MSSGKKISNVSGAVKTETLKKKTPRQSREGLPEGIRENPDRLRERMLWRREANG
jgi:hypothetical protein